MVVAAKGPWQRDGEMLRQEIPGNEERCFRGETSLCSRGLKGQGTTSWCWGCRWVPEGWQECAGGPDLLWPMPFLPGEAVSSLSAVPQILVPVCGP